MINLDKKSLVAVALTSSALMLSSTSVSALELGFEALANVVHSDNVYGANAGQEEAGQIGFGLIGIYGEQRGRVAQGAFSGEIETQKVLSDDDDKFDALTRFAGAINIGITPKTLSWYVGDILGAVRADDGIQTSEDEDSPRRNVFVTGPSLQYDLGAFSQVNSRLLFVHQSDEDGELASLYNFSAGWETDTARGSTWGLRLSNIYTDQSDNLRTTNVTETDFNRLSASVFWQRTRGRNSLYAGLGATNYKTDDDGVSGLYAAFSIARQLNPQQTISLSLNRDLQDETLSTIESLIDDGTGERPETNGFFDETRLELGYGLQNSQSSIDAGVGVAVSDYQLLADIDSTEFINDDSEDQIQPYAYAVWSRRVNPRLRTELSLNYEQLDYDNRNDESSSILVGALAAYKLSRSFTLELEVSLDQADGLRTRFANNVAVEEDIDITESRASIGLRWAPPSRASKALTVELKSLLE